MKNRINLSGVTNDERHLDPLRRFLTVFVGTCAVVLLLAAGSPPLQAQARTAPEDEQAFHRLVDGQRMINTDDLSILAAQNWTEMSDPVRPYVIRSTDGNGLSCGLATQEEMNDIREMLNRRPPRTTPSGKYALAPPAANISVNYTGFTPGAQAAFQRAVDIWSSLLITTVPIEIEASFTTLEEEDILGATRLSSWRCAASLNICFPLGLINQIRSEDLDPDKPDILVTMSSSEDWYFGLDGRPGEDQFDFVSVVLHEIGHGLGFYDSFKIDESTEEAEYGIGADNIPTIFDHRIFDTKINQLIDEDEYTNPSTALTDAVTGIKLFWGGPKTLTANGGSSPVLLWAPEDFDGGSSVAHLDQHAYPPGTPNELMNPSQPSGMATHDPGPIVLAMLEDMLWTIRDQTLQIPQFAVGGGFSSDVVVTNRSSTEPAAVAIDVWDPEGNALDGNLILGVGADRFDLSPSGSRTLTLLHDGSDLLTGSITVSSDTPVSAVVRFDFQGTGITGVGTSPRLRAAIAPVRRVGNLSSGVAIRNPELAAQTIDLELRDEDGLVVPGGEASRHIEAGGRIAEFIEQFFPEADTTDFKGDISIRARAGQIAVIVLELEVGRAFTTLPVSPYDYHREPTPAEDERGDGASLAPADQDAFNDVFVGKRVLSGVPNYFIDFISPGRFKETEGSDVYPGSYTYRNTGSDTGTVTLNYDDGDRCTFQLTFATATSGSATFSCNDGTSGNTSWRLVDIPSDDDDEDTSQTCVKGSVIKPGGSCDLKDADGMKIGTFSVSDSGRGCLRIGSITLCQGNRFNHDGTRLNQYVVTFIASKGSDGSWTISKISIS